jgi:uncharacterized protein YjbJ (UPF0337 family)
MTSDILEGKWKQIRGRVKEAWGDLTDDELDMIDGRRDRLVGKLQERYGHSRMEAEQEVDRFLTDLDDDPDWDHM